MPGPADGGCSAQRCRRTPPLSEQQCDLGPLRSESSDGTKAPPPSGEPLILTWTPSLRKTADVEIYVSTHTKVSYQICLFITMSESSALSVSTCVHLTLLGQKDRVELTQHHLKTQKHNVTIIIQDHVNEDRLSSYRYLHTKAILM